MTIRHGYPILIVILAALLCVSSAVFGQIISETTVTASDGDDGDNFGNAVDIDGDFAIVGARFDDSNGDNAGAAYIYRRVSGTWVEDTKILPSDGVANDLFGADVAISGDIAVVGSMQGA